MGVHPAARVVSLAPSLTETVFALGRGPLLVARTRYCIRPEAALALPSIGGTKDPDLEAIRALAPDLILANREENRREDVLELERGCEVLVSYPRSPLDSAGLIEELGERLDARSRASGMGQAIRAELLAGPPPGPRIRAAYLIWRQPWMTVTAETYTGRLLEESGFENVFAGLPGRYPEVRIEDLAARRAQVLLLPDEPYRFAERHRQELERQLAPARAICVPGEPWCWWGARTLEGLRGARALRARLPAAG